MNKHTKKSVAALKKLATQVTFKDSNSVRRRMGVNGIDRLSVYNVSKWLTFGKDIRNKYKAEFPQAVIDKTFTGWFLKIPAENGFIDLIATWVDKPCGNMHYYSVALNDNQTIFIDGEPQVFNAGDVCWFNIKSTYEILSAPKEQLWACLLVAEY